MPTKLSVLNIIPTRLLKQILHGCIPAITKIINLSLDKGDFSAEWKSAVVHPLIKSLSKGTINNYRLVSILPFISKVAEKCTLQLFSDHCNTHNLLPEYQSAYRQTFSCETSLLKLANNILWGMDKKRHHFSHSSQAVGCLWYCQPQPIAQSIRQKGWHQGQCSTLVLTMSQTIKI